MTRCHPFIPVFNQVEVDEAEFRLLFKKYDEDRSGTLSAAECKELCKDLGSELDDDELMAAMDR